MTPHSARRDARSDLLHGTGGVVSQKRAAAIAGAMYLLQMTTAIAGYVVRSSLAVAGDAGATAQRIVGAERLYRVSIAADIITIVAVVILTWALYVLLKPVDSDLALLGAFFRLIENAILIVMAVNLVASLQLLAPAEYLNPFQASQLHALGRLARSGHATGFNIGFIFVGLGTVVFASLLFTSRYIPRFISGFGIAAAALMAVCALLIVVFPRAAQPLQLVSFGPMFVYEVGLGAWLLFRGVRPAPSLRQNA
jgi:hypothetical protein